MDLFFRDLLSAYYDGDDHARLDDFLRIGGDFEHILLTIAELSECDNAQTECANAQLRRKAKAAVQTLNVSSTALSTHWVLMCSRNEALSLLGHRSMYEPEAGNDDEADEDEAQMKAGYGGLQRAFVSHHAKSKTPGCRLDNNQLDFKRIGVMYTVARDTSDPLLEELVPRGKHATQAGRSQFTTHQSHGYVGGMSSFGTVLKQEKARRDQRANNKMLAMDFQVHMVQLCNSSQHHAAVAFRQSAFHDLLLRQAGHKLDDRLQALRNISRAVAVQESVSEREAVERARASLAVIPARSGPGPNALDLSRLIPKGAALRALPGPPGLEHRAFVDPCIQLATAKVAAMNEQHDTLAAPLLKAWQNHHVMSKLSDLPERKELSAEHKLSPCYVHGFGMCLCQGDGILVSWMRKSFQQKLYSFAKRNAKFKSLLSSGFVVAKFENPVQTLWYHIALQYLRPQRSTFLELTARENNFWGYQRLEAEPSSDHTFRLEVDARTFDGFENRDPMTFQLYHIVALPRSCEPLLPRESILVQDLEDELGAGKVRFWGGAAREVQKEKDRQARVAAYRRRKEEMERGLQAPKSKRRRFSWETQVDLGRPKMGPKRRGPGASLRDLIKTLQGGDDSLALHDDDSADDGDDEALGRWQLEDGLLDDDPDADFWQFNELETAPDSEGNPGEGPTFTMTPVEKTLLGEQTYGEGRDSDDDLIFHDLMNGLPGPDEDGHDAENDAVDALFDNENGSVTPLSDSLDSKDGDSKAKHDGPKDTGKEPEDTGKELEDTNKEPEDTSKELEDTGKEPEDTGKELEDTNKEPEDTSKDKGVGGPSSTAPTSRDVHPASRTGPRCPCAEDASDKAPPGATLRKYIPKNGKPPYWAAVLPCNAEDDMHKHSQSRVWTEATGRTEEAVFKECLDWLWKWHENIRQPQMPDATDSDSISSCSSSSESAKSP